MRNTQLKIADFCIDVLCQFDFELEVGYVPFVNESPTGNPDLTIECKPGLKEMEIDTLALAFRAENEEQRFYDIYTGVDNELMFVIYDQQNRSDIQQIGVLSADLKKWTLYIDDGFPLKYPFGPIMLHYLTLQTNAVMMHASCAFDGVKGRMFTGFSGVGKSTMSMLWSKAGSMIVNDDRLIIRKQDDQYWVHNTPMYYSDRPKKTVLNGIFLISHAPVNRIKKLSGVEALSRARAFSIQNNFDRRFVEHSLNVFGELVEKVNVYDLGFVPDASVVTFIKENE